MPKSNNGQLGRGASVQLLGTSFVVYWPSSTQFRTSDSCIGLRYIHPSRNIISSCMYAACHAWCPEAPAPVPIAICSHDPSFHRHPERGHSEAWTKLFISGKLWSELVDFVAGWTAAWCADWHRLDSLQTPTTRHCLACRISDLQSVGPKPVPREVEPSTGTRLIIALPLPSHHCFRSSLLPSLLSPLTTVPRNLTSDH